MTTRYSLPAAARDADVDSARCARTLAALILVLGLFTAALGTAFLPQAEGAMAVAPEGEVATAQPGV
jgi:hypothetical protein